MPNNYGRPLYPQLRYCLRCCMPETVEGLAFDEMGICKACRASEEKMHINWVKRQEELSRILSYYKRRAGNNYDCIVPISGGKDSIFQVHVLVKIYRMKPLAVTFNHNWFSNTGKYNLANCLEKLNVDHIMFTPNRSLVNRLARHSLYKIGDACWHCHVGVEAFPYQVAVKWGIPLVVYGEPLGEHSGKKTYSGDKEMEIDHFQKYSAKVQPQDMICKTISAKDIFPFKGPTLREIKKAKIKRIFLGSYIFWDLERQVEFIKKEYGWREDRVESTYKRYKSVECVMPGVHDYAKFIKRGYGRGTDFASLDVRAGILTRQEGFELAKKYDSARPKALDYYLKITGLTEKEFIKVLKSHRKGAAKKLP